MGGLEVGGGNRLLAALAYLAGKAKDNSNWRWLAADCGEGYKLARRDDGRAEAWDLLAFGVIMKRLGVSDPMLVGLLETDFRRGLSNLRDYMPSNVNWEPLAAFSDLGRRGSFFQSLLGIFMSLHRRYIDRVYWGCGSSPYRGGIGLPNLLRMAPRHLRSIRATVQGGSIWEFVHPQAVSADISAALSYSGDRPSEADLNAIQEACCRIGETVWSPYLNFDLLSHDAFSWGRQALPTMGRTSNLAAGLRK